MTTEQMELRIRELEARVQQLVEHYNGDAPSPDCEVVGDVLIQTHVYDIHGRITERWQRVDGEIVDLLLQVPEDDLGDYLLGHHPEQLFSSELELLYAAEARRVAAEDEDAEAFGGDFLAGRRVANEH